MSDFVRFGEIAKEFKKNIKATENSHIDKYVALEHIIPSKMNISNFGDFQKDKPSFSKYFEAGMILFVKRRCYQKKSGVPNFSGICSGDIIVIEAIEEFVLPKFLPFIVNSSNFFNWAIKNSSGSLSPRTKFKLLSDFKFKLPNKDRQKELLKILEKIQIVEQESQDLINSYSLLKKVFIKEYLPLKFSKDISHKLNDFLTVAQGLEADGSVSKKLTVKLYGKGIVSKDDHQGSVNTKYYQRKKGQFIYSKLDFLNGAFAVIPEALDKYYSTNDLPAFDVNPQLNEKWLNAYVTRPEFYEAFRTHAKGGRKAKRISPKDFLATEIPLYPIETQESHVRAIEHMEDSIRNEYYKIKQLEKIRERLVFGEI